MNKHDGITEYRTTGIPGRKSLIFRYSDIPLLPILFIIVGILLRFLWIGDGDFLTDEAQFSLGLSAAQPPAGMAYLRLLFFLFAPSEFWARAMAAIAGVASIFFLWKIAALVADRRTAWFVAAFAALFPAHIIFSRLAFLSAPLFASELALLFFFLRTSAPREGYAGLLITFLLAVLTTFIKTQGVVFPFLLLIGRILVTRKHFWRDPLVIVLFLSLIPITLYIATHPGIAATLLTYGGSQYGFSAPVDRLIALFHTWWSALGWTLPLLFFAIPGLRKLSWPVNALILFSVVQGFLLGTDNAYYALDLAVLSLPLAITIVRFRFTAHIFLTLFAVVSFLAVLPQIRVTTEERYWQDHAAEINAAVADAEQLIVMGYAGHHLRWYLEPELRLGNEESLDDAGTFLVLLSWRGEMPEGEVLYEDGETKVIR